LRRTLDDIPLSRELNRRYGGVRDASIKVGNEQ
jgi:hypothetical protein